ncbi:MAG: hypothetical protein ABJC13_18365 [Acidobacteriota bacterium]
MLNQTEPTRLPEEGIVPLDQSVPRDRQRISTYLERQFHETRQRFEQLEAQVGSLREETRQRFEQLDEWIRDVMDLIRERFAIPCTV